jgi:hypothetical protein
MRRALKMENDKDHANNVRVGYEIPGQTGPNGYRVLLLPDGSQAEEVPDEECPGEFFYLLRVRGCAAIVEEYKRCSEKVWWNRHQWTLQERAARGLPLSDNPEVTERALAAAKRVEEKYDRSELELGEFDWGLLNGRMSAFAWVLGGEWDESLDT